MIILQVNSWTCKPFLDLHAPIGLPESGSVKIMRNFLSIAPGSLRES